MSSKDMVKIVPGDTLVVRLPRSQPKQNITCSVRVLDKKPKKSENFVGQIMDMVLLTKGPTNMAPGETVELPKANIVSVIPSTINGVKSDITIEISSGTISGLWRTDGKQTPLNIRIIDNDIEFDQIFKVDATSSESLTHANDSNDMPMFPEIENA